MKLNNSNKYNINDSNYPEMKGFFCNIIYNSKEFKRKLPYNIEKNLGVCTIQFDEVFLNSLFLPFNNLFFQNPITNNLFSYNALFCNCYLSFDINGILSFLILINLYLIKTLIFLLKINPDKLYNFFI